MDAQIVLVRPQFEGNIGAIARVMANFGFSKLVLVDPQCDHKSQECRSRAKHAQRILDEASIISRLDNLSVDLRVATSAKLGSDYNIPRIPLSPSVLAEKLSAHSGSFALVFGPENVGLLNEELELCDLFVSIPAHKSYPVLNLSHSVAVLLYELSKEQHEQVDSKQFPLMSLQDKEVLFSLLDELIASVEFETPEKAKTQTLVWKRLFSKAFLSKREVFAVLGLLKKLLRRR